MSDRDFHIVKTKEIIPRPVSWPSPGRKRERNGKKAHRYGLGRLSPESPAKRKGIGKIHKLSDNIVRLTLPKDTCPSGNEFMRRSLPRPVITGFVEFLDGELTAKDILGAC